VRNPSDSLPSDLAAAHALILAERTARLESEEVRHVMRIRPSGGRLAAKAGVAKVVTLELFSKENDSIF
jgi:hypothetical protein